MVAGVESGIRAIDGREKGQQMDSAEDSSQRTAQEGIQFGKTATGKAVDIGNQLNLIFHDSPFRRLVLNARRKDLGNAGVAPGKEQT